MAGARAASVQASRNCALREIDARAQSLLTRCKYSRCHLAVAIAALLADDGHAHLVCSGSAKKKRMRLPQAAAQPLCCIIRHSAAAAPPVAASLSPAVQAGV